jgi:hypothetical protein
MSRGNVGIDGNAGNLESVSYRFYRDRQGSNPTLSANSLTGGSVVGSSGGLQSRRVSLALAASGGESLIGAIASRFA